MGKYEPFITNPPISDAGFNKLMTLEEIETAYMTGVFPAKCLLLDEEAERSFYVTAGI